MLFNQDLNSGTLCVWAGEEEYLTIGSRSGAT
jgi:hypothetical protein